MPLEFLDLHDVLGIHRDQIERYGGDLGVRDIGLLESAIAMPAAGFGDEYLHRDIFEMAAAYLFHIVMNHAFVDGNKRAGAVTAIAFLRINEVDVKVKEPELVEIVLAVVEGKTDKSALAQWFRERCRIAIS